MSQRPVRPSDRVVEACGLSGEKQLLAEVVAQATDLHAPKPFLVIGPDNAQQDLLASFDKLTDRGGDQILLVPNPEGADGRGSLCHFLASERAAEGVINTVNSRKIAGVILLCPDHDSGHLAHLASVLKQTAARVYILECVDDPRNGLFARTEVDGYDLIPADVDFEAEDEEDEEIPPLPEDAMYGKAAEYARMLRVPIGFAYAAVLAMLSVFVKNTASIRAALFVALIGDVGEGKTVATDRAGQLFGLLDASGSPISPLCKRTTPASDRGLLKLFPGPEVAPCALALDELRQLMSKGSIENSTLISTLCQLWSQDSAGTIDKKGLDECRVRLSILGNLKIGDPSEFPAVFTHATAHGLFDRFLFGVRAGEKWRFSPWELDAVVQLDPYPTTVTQAIFDMKNEWEDDGEKRGRLAEQALRVAYITASINRDMTVSDEAMSAALRFMEWQERLREVYQAAKGSSEQQECVNEVLDQFEKAPGHALNWRETCRKKHWHRRFPRSLTSVKRMLEADRVLVLHKESGKHYLNAEVVGQKRKEVA